MHIRTGDKVIIIAGTDKGKTGDVVRAFPKENRVIVEGVNLRWKHRKPTQQQPQGERVRIEYPIHASNVMHYDAQAEKGVRRRPGQEG